MTNLDKNKELRSFTQESFDKSVADAAAKCDKEELISQYDPTITMAEIIDKYKALKAADKVSVRNQKVVDRVADEDAGIEEKSHEELQVVCTKYDPNTGEAQDDSVTAYSLSGVKHEIDYRKAQVAKLQAEQAEWEQLEVDLSDPQLPLHIGD